MEYTVDGYHQRQSKKMKNEVGEAEDLQLARNFEWLKNYIPSVLRIQGVIVNSHFDTRTFLSLMHRFANLHAHRDLAWPRIFLHIYIVPSP
jgi:hypothetical protein